MRSPSRIEFSYADNENILETDRNMTRRPLARTCDVRNAKDLTSSSTEYTVPMPQSPVLVNEPGIWSPAENRGNDTSYDREIKSHYYAPMRKEEMENNRLYPQQVRNNEYDNSSEIVP